MEEVRDPNTTAAAEITFDAAGASVIKLSGEVDMSNVDSLRTTIEPAVANVPTDVIFDLSELAFMDSSGIALLLQVAAKAQSVRIRQPSALVRRMIEATGLTEVLPVES